MVLCTSKTCLFALGRPSRMELRALQSLASDWYMLPFCCWPESEPGHIKDVPRTKDQAKREQRPRLALQGNKAEKKVKIAVQGAQKRLDDIVRQCEAGKLSPQVSSPAYLQADGTSDTSGKLDVASVTSHPILFDLAMAAGCEQQGSVVHTAWRLVSYLAQQGSRCGAGCKAAYRRGPCRSQAHRHCCHFFAPLARAAGRRRSLWHASLRLDPLSGRQCSDS